MLRAALFTTLAIAAIGPCFAADQIATPHVRREARGALPPGLPRVHYKARTTVVYQPAPPPVVVVENDPDVLISVPSTPILPGSSTLPGYYGRAFDYHYQGPYYGDNSYPSYFFRLPYACGVTGYC
ncbi:MAG TPA: hypothetical protein VKY22_24830 [Bradyrhizobium sp.]|nr:hypothetical protein [Bradyrhizobium sp.]